MSAIAAPPTLSIDGIAVPINGERNLLELIRKTDIDLPTFCYHSDLSVYGACRLCIVDIAGRGIQGACSTAPEPGLVVRTQTEEIREIRKISVELLLANHERECTTCSKSASCQLQDVARRLGINKVRFKAVHEPAEVDRSSPSVTRDPNKCVLCGDCVRFCSEIQGIGAIDFAHRGHDVAVLPAFGNGLGEGECINCGQCAAVCPTGALTPRQEIDEVWKALVDPTKTVVAQIAPAVRIALGELFGMQPGESTRGQMVAALKRLGFKYVYDTAFAADLTVIEESNEFLARKSKAGKLPLFTSCCPAWVKFAEQYFPELLPNLSTCKSPQQMLGALVKELLPQELGVAKENLVMVSIMPCTAKKFEAKRPEFAHEGVAEVDHVLTTQELARMIEEAGLRFMKLQPESFDMPMGFKTGAGVIFGNSGGVSEAVLRYASEKVTGRKLTNPDIHAVRGEDGLRIVEVPVGDITLKLGIVHGLKNARTLAEKARHGNCDLDIIEVMACPGGCIGGPVSRCRAIPTFGSSAHAVFMMWTRTWSFTSRRRTILLPSATSGISVRSADGTRIVCCTHITRTAGESRASPSNSEMATVRKSYVSTSAPARHASSKVRSTFCMNCWIRWSRNTFKRRSRSTPHSASNSATTAPR